VLHVLSAGNRFNLVERTLLPNETWSRKVEAAVKPWNDVISSTPTSRADS
jgi:hypothetical protein